MGPVGAIPQTTGAPLLVPIAPGIEGGTTDPKVPAGPTDVAVVGLMPAKGEQAFANLGWEGAGRRGTRDPGPGLGAGDRDVVFDIDILP